MQSSVNSPYRRKIIKYLMVDLSLEQFQSVFSVAVEYTPDTIKRYKHLSSDILAFVTDIFDEALPMFSGRDFRIQTQTNKRVFEKMLELAKGRKLEHLVPSFSFVYKHYFRKLFIHHSKTESLCPLCSILKPLEEKARLHLDRHPPLTEEEQAKLLEAKEHQRLFPQQRLAYRATKDYVLNDPSRSSVLLILDFSQLQTQEILLDLDNRFYLLTTMLLRRNDIRFALGSTLDYLIQSEVAIRTVSQITSVINNTVVNAQAHSAKILHEKPKTKVKINGITAHHMFEFVLEPPTAKEVQALKKLRILKRGQPARAAKDPSASVNNPIWKIRAFQTSKPLITFLANRTRLRPIQTSSNNTNPVPTPTPSTPTPTPTPSTPTHPSKRQAQLIKAETKRKVNHSVMKQRQVRVIDESSTKKKARSCCPHHPLANNTFASRARPTEEQDEEEDDEEDEDGDAEPTTRSRKRKAVVATEETTIYFLDFRKLIEIYANNTIAIDNGIPQELNHEDIDDEEFDDHTGNLDIYNEIVEDAAEFSLGDAFDLGPTNT
eukprot:gene17014-20254_t